MPLESLFKIQVVAVMTRDPGSPTKVCVALSTLEGHHLIPVASGHMHGVPLVKCGMVSGVAPSFSQPLKKKQTRAGA